MRAPNRTESTSETYVRKYEGKYKKAKPSLIEIVHRFGSEEVCRDYLEQLRWPDGVFCPRCASVSISEITTRAQYDCNDCRFRFSVTAGTIFDNTKLPLWKWLAVAYLMIESKKAMSANQISRTLSISYKTAWHLCHRIREAMETTDSEPVLFGIIEVDETLLKPRRRHPVPGISGLKHNTGGMGPGKDRVWIAGALQRNGQVRLRRVPNVKKATLQGFINSFAKPTTEAIYTDGLQSYLGVADGDTRHEKVNHDANEWGRGDVHTNGIESVWGLFKRSIVGAYHKISAKHLDAYIQEMEWRFNNRDNPHMLRDVMKKILKGEALRYEKLTA